MLVCHEPINFLSYVSSTCCFPPKISEWLSYPMADLLEAVTTIKFIFCGAIGRCFAQDR
jgi:hypothetical protein